MIIKYLLQKMGPIKMKFFFMFTVLVGVYLFLFYLYGIHNHMWQEPKTPEEVVVMKSLPLPYVVVHIDLKGSPPKLKYLKSLLPDMKKQGANGLLMEYEDMFPYSGRIANISALNCYKTSELQDFLRVAYEQGFEIIPLVQTFGHLEHVLKLTEFSDLRESPMYPDSLCPSKQESKFLVHLMLEQVIKFHENIQPLKHIHVGCDEVFQLNKCPQCLKKQTSNIKIFLEHLQYITATVRDLSPNTTVLIWDDMIRPINPLQWVNLTQESAHSNLDNIEPVYWDYTPKLKGVSNGIIYNYHKVFRNTWVASAFKGAEGSTATMPRLYNRGSNHLNWLSLMFRLKIMNEDNFDFKGIILTGWSRYSHMDPPCELLPVSYPSLILSLLVVKRFKQGLPELFYNQSVDFHDFYKMYLINEYKNILKCNSVKNVDLAFSWICTFEGYALMSMLYRYNRLSQDILEQLFGDDVPPLATYEYYEKYNFINMKHTLWSLSVCNDTLSQLEEYEERLYKKMRRYYYEESIQEYVSYKCSSIKYKIEAIRSSLYRYVNKARYWDRNPNYFA